MVSVSEDRLFQNLCDERDKHNVCEVPGKAGGGKSEVFGSSPSWGGCPFVPKTPVLWNRKVGIGDWLEWQVKGYLMIEV
jgi:hypothetical protein